MDEIAHVKLYDAHEAYYKVCNVKSHDGIKLMDVDNDLLAKVFTKLDNQDVYHQKFHHDLNKKIDDIGDLHNPKVLGPAEFLSKEIPEGRIDYSKRFLEDLINFDKGTGRLRSGPLKQDVWLVNFHDLTSL